MENPNDSHKEYRERQLLIRMTRIRTICLAVLDASLDVGEENATSMVDLLKAWHDQPDMKAWVWRPGIAQGLPTAWKMRREEFVELGCQILQLTHLTVPELYPILMKTIEHFPDIHEMFSQNELPPLFPADFTAAVIMPYIQSVPYL